MSEKKPSKKGNGSKKGSSGRSGPMDLSLLERIVKLMQTNDLNMIELRDGDQRVILRRGAGETIVQAMPGPITSSGGIGGKAAASDGGAASADDANAGLIAIKSPMVGTFYAAASPDAKPFVSVGSTVDEETDVCVIEAMKVFNNVKAECRGTIAKIAVTNGQVVEFDQVLFWVKP